MYTSLFDIFSIGIGPSSSHTMGPMRAAAQFTKDLEEQDYLSRTARVQTELYGSLALTGEGHGTPGAVVYGLLGLDAETFDLNTDYLSQVQTSGQIALSGKHAIRFKIEQDIILNKEVTLPEHSNGMRLRALTAFGELLYEETFFSVGGGAVRRRSEMSSQNTTAARPVPYQFRTCSELIELCRRENITIAGAVRCNEGSLRPMQLVTHRIRHLCNTMSAAIERGISTPGTLPGPLKLTRRAPIIYSRLEKLFHDNRTDALTIIDWINLWAFAVAEENAAGGRVVTAPTMGSAGVLPAVLRYYERYGHKESPFPYETGREVFILTASAICCLYRENASISGAEVGCQGEVGVACSMAAAGLAAAMGGTNEQIENAAEIAMEHNLGLTCDPICGLVQVPCIERNAIGAVKAVNATRLALRGDGSHYVSLDSVIATMYETGQNLHSGYKETALAGLARNALTC